MRETSSLALSISPTSPLLADASRAVVAGLNLSAGTSCRSKVASNIVSGYIEASLGLLYRNNIAVLVPMRANHDVGRPFSHESLT